MGRKARGEDNLAAGSANRSEDDGSGEHFYALIAVGPSGNRTKSSPAAKAAGLATLRWDSVAGADAYIIVRDGKEIAGPLRVEGSQKEWKDQTK